MDVAVPEVLSEGATRRLAEFVDVPVPGSSLFVLSSWSPGLPDRLPADTDTTLCEVLACDGERCWEGSLHLCDLAGPLSKSWSDPCNLKLLCSALAPQPASTMPVHHEDVRMPTQGGTVGLSRSGTVGLARSQTFSRGGTIARTGTLARGNTFGNLARQNTVTGVGRKNLPALGEHVANEATGHCIDVPAERIPTADAMWTCDDGPFASLHLSIRFLHREGPIVAVQSVCLKPIDMFDGRARFSSFACDMQCAANIFIESGQKEISTLQVQRDALQRELSGLPEVLKDEEERLLSEFLVVLNSQKRRCRDLWQASRGENSNGPSGVMPLLRAGMPKTPTFKDCLDREEGQKLDSLVPSSINFGTMCLPGLDVQGDGPSMFTIPITLGMEACSLPFPPSTSAQCSKTMSLKKGIASGPHALKQEQMEASSSRPVKRKTNIFDSDGW